MKILRKAIYPDNTYESIDLGGDDTEKIVVVNNTEISEKSIRANEEKFRNIGVNDEDTPVANALEHTDSPPPESEDEALPIPKIDFSGQGDVVIDNEDEDEPLTIPTMNFGGQGDVAIGNEDEDEALTIPKIDFSRQGEAVTGNESEDENAPLVIPVINFGKPEEKQNEQRTVRDEDEDGPLVIPVINFGKPEEKQNEQGTDSDTDDEPLTIPTMNFGKEQGIV
jgi:hypothetical protein